jgi:hypothetical protein
MAKRKSPQQRAMDQIVNVKSVMILPLVWGFALLAWAAMNTGFGVDIVVWFGALLLGGAAWAVGVRFSQHPRRGLVGPMWAGAVAFTVVWIGAFAASAVVWEDVTSPAIVGAVSSAIATFLMVLMPVLGGRVLGPVSQATGRGSPAVAPEGISCPTCGKFVDAGVAVCSTCGATLDGA